MHNLAIDKVVATKKPTRAEVPFTVVSVPSKRGFGSRLLEQGLSQDLGGLVSLDFPSSGVVCSIGAPMAEIGRR